MKDKKNIMVLTDADKALDKIQYHFMIKQLGIEENRK